MKNPIRRPPGRPRSEEIKRPKDELILETATRLFLDQGYQKVSVDDISHASNVTKATVYYYYKSKTELFTEAMIHMMGRIRESIHSLLTADKPLKARLYDVALTHFQATTAVDMDSYLRETKTTLSEEQLKKMKAAEDRMYETIAAAIEEGIQAGEVRDVAPLFAAHAFSMMLQTGHHKQKDGSRLFDTPEKAAEALIDLYWNGLDKKL